MNPAIRRSPWFIALALPTLQLGAGMIATAVVTAAFGAREGLGVAAGACAVAAGFLVFGWRTALRPQVISASGSFTRLLVGLGLKWLVVVAILAVAWRGDAVGAAGVLAGVLVAYVAYFFSLSWLLK